MKIKHYSHIFYMLTLCSLAFLLGITEAKAQSKKSKSTSNIVSYDKALYDAMQFRLVGSFRGGRAAGVTGVPSQPNVYYQAVTGGGVWKTIDGGQTWACITDGYFGGSIGAVAVADSDANILYVATGEHTVRGNVSPGYGGFWKSYDAGETWEKMNLNIDQVQSSRIRIHPTNPDVVFIAIIGDLFKDTQDRGVYKSIDGGKNWKKVLFANAGAGAADLVIDPGNARVLYATTWKIKRTPYSLESGGEGSALWKSTDMGETWKNISTNKGLPSGTWGISGVSVSPVNNKRVYALIENDKGGLFRSDDAGATWSLVSADRNLRQRAWYYTRVIADTQLEDRVYVMNVDFWQSNDGGRNFQQYDTPHGDHHDLWIDPNDNNRMIVGDDGGAQISNDAGKNWSTYMNQPTSQYYRVTTDNAFPYNILVAQQDNSTQRIAHRTDGSGITERDWESTAGGESGHLAADPNNPNIVYGGSYGGLLTRVDHETGEQRVINVWPDNPMGHGAENMRYRFQWNFPIFFSPNDAKKLYVTSNRVHVTTNEGQSWDVISPDLTRNEPEKLKTSGGPITQDNTSVEYYATIFAACESPYETGLLWAASDDGLIHVSQNAGKSWENVTPTGAPKYIMWNSVEPDPFTKGGMYAAGTSYKSGDYAPYLFKTKDYGKTWTKIVSGIASNHFTRVVRADPSRAGLLYAGTESGLYISFDDGESWSTFQLNLPMTSVTDLALKNKNLIVATQGRSAWIMDDLTPLHQLKSDIASAEATLLKPIDSYLMGRPSWGGPSKTDGQNHHNGVKLFFNLKNAPADKEEVKIILFEADGDTIDSFSTTAKERSNKLTVKAGSNSFVWDMRHPDAEGFDKLIMWAARLTGPKAVPGTYKAALVVNGKTYEQNFTILADKRSSSSQSDLQAQFDFLVSVRDKVTETHKTIKEIRTVREQMMDWKKKLNAKDHKEILALVDSTDKSMTSIEEALYQTKNQSGQDPLNFPIRLNNKYAHLSSVVGSGNFRPTDQAVALKKELELAIDAELAKWKEIKESQVPAFNQSVKAANIDAIILK
jgi:photosystem II stability/assembly factor-like uncharacterized protein